MPHAALALDTAPRRSPRGQRTGRPAVAARRRDRDRRRAPEEFERLSHVPRDVIALFKQAGIYRAGTPRRFGGDALAPTAFLDMIERIATADGSAAWVASFGSANVYLAALPLDTGRAVCERPRSGVRGRFVPGAAGPAPAGRLARERHVEVRERLQGADWLGVGIAVPGAQDAAPNKPRTAVFRAADVEIVENWSVVGMQGHRQPRPARGRPLRARSVDLCARRRADRRRAAVPLSDRRVRGAGAGRREPRPRTRGARRRESHVGRPADDNRRTAPRRSRVLPHRTREGRSATALGARVLLRRDRRRVAIDPRRQPGDARQSACCGSRPRRSHAKARASSNARTASAARRRSIARTRCSGCCATRWSSRSTRFSAKATSTAPARCSPVSRRSPAICNRHRPNCFERA